MVQKSTLPPTYFPRSLTEHPVHYVLHKQNSAVFAKPHRSTLTMRLTFTSDTIYTPAIVYIKISMLLCYREFFRVVVWVNRVVWCMIAISCIILLMTIIGMCLFCTPIEHYYDPKTGTCSIADKGGTLFITIANPVIDLIIVIIPLLVIARLQNMTPMKKFGISLMFGLGIL